MVSNISNEKNLNLMLFSLALSKEVASSKKIHLSNILVKKLSLEPQSFTFRDYVVSKLNLDWLYLMGAPTRLTQLGFTVWHQTEHPFSLNHVADGDGYLNILNAQLTV